MAAILEITNESNETVAEVTLKNTTYLVKYLTTPMEEDFCHLPSRRNVCSCLREERNEQDVAKHHGTTCILGNVTIDVDRTAGIEGILWECH